MSAVLEKLPFGSRVAIIRLRSLGDCVLTTPAIEILKTFRPDLRLAVVVEPRFQGIFEGNPNLDVLMRPSYTEIARWKPALTVNLHGGTRSMLLTAASRARFRVGFEHHRYASLYTGRIPRAQRILGEERVVHTAEHLASAMFWLGCQRCEIPRASLYAAPPPERLPYAVIHPFAAAAYKTWRADGFLAVAERIREKANLDVVVIGGPTDDFGLFRFYRVVAGAPLAEVKTLISGASLFVGNDSGPAHIAAAFGVPLAVLFGRTEHRAVWAPWRAERAETLVSEKGIATLPVNDALAAVDRLMSFRKAR